MYNYNNEYSQPQFESDYEFNEEAGPGFEMENFEQENEFSNEYESEDELNSEYDMEDEDEYEDEFQYEANNEYNNEYESPNWENEVRVIDHRTRPSVIRPIPATTYNRPRTTAPYYTRSGTTTPYRPATSLYRPGYRPATSLYRPGYRPATSLYRPGYRPATSLNRPGYRPVTNWYNRHRNLNYRYPVGHPWYRRHHRYPPYSYSPYTSTSMGSNIESPGQQFQDTPGSAPQQPQDGSFKNYVIETLKGLTDTISTLKNATPNDQPGPGGMDPGMSGTAPGTMEPGNTGTPPVTPPKDEAPPSSEFEMENYEYDMEQEGEVSDREGSFHEMTEMELASELLNVNNETELNYFIGGLLKKAVGTVTGIMNTPQGKILGDLLKGVAKKALPIAGAAAGAYFGGPLGAKIGGNVGSAVSQMFELELEGLSNEDREFEAARAVVRLAGNAAMQLTEQNTGDPKEDARQALIQASALYAPGLITRRDTNYENNNNSGYDSNWRR